MTIAEIQKVLRTSFKNGFYIRRPHFVELGIEVYINKDGKTWQLVDGKVFEIYLMNHELKLEDWEIVV
ncbi:hypothetical protein XbC2_426 [Xanthomonas phage XbC2]|nr:hypothetical protein XbC2_426 [Xanthomonas phage XbC2]